MATGITGDCDVVKGQTRVPAPPYTHPTTDTTDQDTEQAECQRVEDLTSETPAWFRHSLWWMVGPGRILQRDGAGCLAHSPRPPHALKMTFASSECEAHTPLGWVPPRSAAPGPGPRRQRH
jgi:hypothetical protein